MDVKDPITQAIIGAAIEVHRGLGPGLLESAYATCLALEMNARGIAYKREVVIPVRYRNQVVEGAYRADFIVEKRVLVEAKSVKAIEPVHKSQVLTYLRLTGLHTGLLLNFNVNALRDGILRLSL